MRAIPLWFKRNFPRPLVKILRLLRRPHYYELVPGPMNYSQDGMATSHNADFLQDPLFMEAYRLGEDTGSWGVRPTEHHWRAYVNCWAAYHAAHLSGDFVECGVYKGGYARAIVHYLNFGTLNKRYYLLDTFQGLAPQYVSPEEKAAGLLEAYRHYQVTDTYEEVRQTFGAFPNVRLVRGPVPDTLPQVDATHLCYLSIDMNNAAPEIAAAEFFWPKLVSGALVVLDDYGHRQHAVQKRAFDAFAQQRGLRILTLPTAQGLILKP